VRIDTGSQNRPLELGVFNDHIRHHLETEEQKRGWASQSPAGARETTSKPNDLVSPGIEYQLTIE
jgi:hypothetical protein